jgi:hypothetical protein
MDPIFDVIDFLIRDPFTLALALGQMFGEGQAEPQINLPLPMKWEKEGCQYLNTSCFSPD